MTSKPAINRRTRGRASKRTPEAAKRILEALRTGNTVACAARIGGMDPSSLARWRREDRAWDGQVLEAIADSESFLVGLAVAGAKKDGRVALQLLARRFPETWEKREGPSHHVHAHAAIGSDFLAKLVGDRQSLDTKQLEDVDVESEPV